MYVIYVIYVIYLCYLCYLFMLFIYVYMYVICMFFFFFIIACSVQLTSFNTWHVFSPFSFSYYLMFFFLVSFLLIKLIYSVESTILYGPDHRRARSLRLPLSRSSRKFFMTTRNFVRRVLSCCMVYANLSVQNLNRS